MARHTLAAFVAVALAWTAALAAAPQQSHDHGAQRPPHSGMGAMTGHEHGPAGLSISYTQLRKTAEQLNAAREATAKYQDVRMAEADGYRAVGPDVPGMGIHYVRRERRDAFSITEPPILLYERDASAPDGLRLTGVSYLLVAPAGGDGQPASSPFPRALARWHKHNNVCVLPGNDATIDLTEAQCTAKGGRFTAETSWMVHAWIWKDSPAGVFSPTNPLVK